MSAAERRPAVFLDRDGTVLDELGYLADPDRVRLYPGAGAAIRRLNEAGLVVVVVTNQSGIARGLLDEDLLGRIHARLDEELLAAGARVDAYYHCPHHPDVGEPPWRMDCDCRKPLPGMFLAAARDLGLDPPRSFAVGDAARDLEAARRAGVRHRILVLTGKGEATRAALSAGDDVHVAADLGAAVELVLAETGQAR